MLKPIVVDGRSVENRPMALVQAADFLASAGRTQEAIELLENAYYNWPTIPPAYDTALGRLLLRAGRSKEAIVLLIRVKSQSKAFPASLNAALGKAFLGAGMSIEAGQAFAEALRGGHRFRDISKLIAAEDAAAEFTGRFIDHSFLPGMSFADLTRRVQYCAIPKNACTMLKATFVMNSMLRADYVSSGEPIHKYFAQASFAFDKKSIKEAKPERVIVLRDPLSRLVSCYLNKFVRSEGFDPSADPIVGGVVRRVQAKRDGVYDPALGITFAEFASYVVNTEDAQFDMHWMPQSRICGTDMSLYGHVGRFERLGDTLNYLTERFGIEPVTDITGHVKSPDVHVTRYDPDCQIDSPWSCMPAQLRASAGGFPVAEAFYNDGLRRAVLDRYAADHALHAAA